MKTNKIIRIRQAKDQLEAYEEALFLLETDHRNEIVHYYTTQEREWTAAVLSAMADLELDLEPEEVEAVSKLCASSSKDVSESAALALDEGGDMARERLSQVLTPDLERLIKISRGC